MPQIHFEAPDTVRFPKHRDVLGCLQLRRTVLLPGTIKNYDTVDPVYWELLLDAAKKDRMLLVMPATSSEAALRGVGTVTRIIDARKESDTRLAFRLHGLTRAAVERVDSSTPYEMARISPVGQETAPDDVARRLVQSICGSLEQLADQGYEVAAYALDQVLTLQRPGVVADMVGATALHSTREHVELLGETCVKTRLETVDHALTDLLRESTQLYPTSRDAMN